MTKPKDVDSYIAEADSEAQPILKEIREIIKSAIPGVEESISWNVPYYKYHGEIGGFSTAKNHVSFGFDAKALEDSDREKLEEEGYKLGKMTLQIRFGQKVPAASIRKIVETKAEMNEKQIMKK